MPTPVEAGSFEHQGSRLAYEIHGSGDRTLVYLHGLLMDSQMNRGLAESLAASGVRVVLLDLLGHGPQRQATAGVGVPHGQLRGRGRGVARPSRGRPRGIGGVSLGADVSLQVAVRAPERVAGLVIEMPVLGGTPCRLPLVVHGSFLLAMHYASGPAGLVARFARAIPRSGIGSIDSLLEALSAPPEVVKAVLHGILTGPVAPTVEQRRAIAVPTLVIAHTSDLLHPFSDATHLVEIVPQARLLSARSIFELRVTPGRLTGEIARFLEQVGSGRNIAVVAG